MEALHQYVKIARQHGQTDGQIRESLSAAGWQDSHISAALGEHNRPAQTPHEHGSRGKRTRKKIIRLAIIALCIAAVVATGGIVILKRPSPPPPQPPSLTTAQVTENGWYSVNIKAFFDTDQRLVLWPVARDERVSEVLLSEDGGNTWTPVPGSVRSTYWQLLGLSFAPSNMLKHNEEPRFIVGYGKPTTTEELDIFDLKADGTVIQTSKRVIDTTGDYLGNGQWTPSKNGPTYEGLMSGSG